MKLINYFLVLLLGVGLGYAWRMVQVDSYYKKEIASLQKRLEENKEAIFRLEGKLAKALLEKERLLQNPKRKEVKRR